METMDLNKINKKKNQRRSPFAHTHITQQGVRASVGIRKILNHIFYPCRAWHLKLM